jgi:hypothetical protein
MGDQNHNVDGEEREAILQNKIQRLENELQSKSKHIDGLTLENIGLKLDRDALKQSLLERAYSPNIFLSNDVSLDNTLCHIFNFLFSQEMIFGRLFQIMKHKCHFFKNKIWRPKPTCNITLLKYIISEASI